MAAYDALRCLHHPLEGLEIRSFVGDETWDDGVIRELMLEPCVATVIREQGIQERNEYAALRGSGAQGQYRGGETAHSHHLGFARQEVQDPVTKGGLQPQAPELANELGGHNSVE